MLQRQPLKCDQTDLCVLILGLQAKFAEALRPKSKQLYKVIFWNFWSYNNLAYLASAHFFFLVFSVMVAHESGLVAHDCNPVIGGQRQSGCTWTVCHGSSPELRISVCIMLNDVDTHKYHGQANRPRLVCASGIMTGHLAMSVLFG